LSNEQFEGLCRQWRIKRYSGASVYIQNGANWHARDGFRVRKAANGKISVFADRTILKEESLEQDFVIPARNSFKPNGELLGDEWAPEASHGMGSPSSRSPSA
jgi:hypothetical protein